MATWSEKRKFIYASIAVLFVVGVVVVPTFLLFYKAPTCFDGKQNGSEKGIDCGGKCSKLCQNNFLAPIVSWSRLEKVVPGVYNASAYIVNQNTEGEAKNVSFRMALYDKDGMLILDKEGKVTIPPHRNTLAFLSSLRVGESIPVKVLFEFTELPDWNKKSDTLSSISVVNKEYLEEGDNSFLKVTLKNSGLDFLYNIAVYVVLYDKDGNVIGFSKTIIDEISPGGTNIAPFTWNINRQGQAVSFEILYVAE